MKLYATASTNPEWETAIKPMFTARKNQLNAEAVEDAPLEAELVEDQPAEDEAA